MGQRLGQHFLNDQRALAHIAKQLDLEGKTVVEVGAGHGELTKHLAKHAKRVVALEKDTALAASLKESLSPLGNVSVVHADALEFDISKYQYFIGNIPYEISSPLIFRLLENGFEQALFLVQKEFAHRLAAKPRTRDWSRLAAMVQARADVAIIGYLGPELFTPPPKVDSALVLLHFNPRYVLDDDLLRMLFQHKNQSARKALEHSADSLGLSKVQARQLAASLPFCNVRARELELEQLAQMSEAFRSLRAKPKG